MPPSLQSPYFRSEFELEGLFEKNLDENELYHYNHFITSSVNDLEPQMLSADAHMGFNLKITSSLDVQTIEDSRLSFEDMILTQEDDYNFEVYNNLKKLDGLTKKDINFKKDSKIRTSTYINNLKVHASSGDSYILNKRKTKDLENMYNSVEANKEFSTQLQHEEQQKDDYTRQMEAVASSFNDVKTMFNIDLSRMSDADKRNADLVRTTFNKDCEIEEIYDLNVDYDLVQSEFASIDFINNDAIQVIDSQNYMLFEKVLAEEKRHSYTMWTNENTEQFSQSQSSNTHQREKKVPEEFRTYDSAILHPKCQSMDYFNPTEIKLKSTSEVEINKIDKMNDLYDIILKLDPSTKTAYICESREKLVSKISGESIGKKSVTYNQVDERGLEDISKRMEQLGYEDVRIKLKRESN